MRESWRPWWGLERYTWLFLLYLGLTSLLSLPTWLWKTNHGGLEVHDRFRMDCLLGVFLGVALLHLTFRTVRKAKYTTWTILEIQRLLAARTDQVQLTWEEEQEFFELRQRSIDGVNHPKGPLRGDDFPRFLGLSKRLHDLKALRRQEEDYWIMQADRAHVDECRRYAQHHNIHIPE